MSFTSLGLKPEILNDTVNHDIVDWVLYLDTNVLYSLLDLHSHPENQACKALIELINSNKDHIKIKLRYTEQTYKELGNRRSDFGLLDDKLTDSSIRAILKTDQLDSFSRKFYSDLLENREATIHPGKVIELSQRTLKEDIVEIGRTGKRLEKIGESYIESRIGDYYSYIAKKNETRREFAEEKKIQYKEIYRSERQVWHDVSLREIVLDSRSLKDGEEATLNNLKYFALTLDGLLISYDKSQLSNYDDERSFPVFFRPSFLLSKLIRVLPIRTTDYKKAFIKAITTKGFHRNSKTSEDILKIVNYLKSRGIDDEKVIYNLISEDIFLEKFRLRSEQSEEGLGEFIESELNREFKAKEKELEEKLAKLSGAEKLVADEQLKNQKLGHSKSTMQEELFQYKSALKKVSKRIKTLESKKLAKSPQIDMNFKAEEEKAKAKEALDEKNKIANAYRIEIEDQIEKHLDKELKKWQQQVWLHLFWVLPLIGLALFLIIPNDYISSSNVDSEGNISQTTKYVTGSIGFVISVIFFKLIHVRYFSEREKNAKRERIKVPTDLKNKLSEFNND